MIFERVHSSWSEEYRWVPGGNQDVTFTAGMPFALVETKILFAYFVGLHRYFVEGGSFETLSCLHGSECKHGGLTSYHIRDAHDLEPLIRVHYGRRKLSIDRKGYFLILFR